jgi:hypothetical protein
VLMAPRTPFVSPLWVTRKRIDAASLALLAMEEVEESLR